MGDDDAIKYVGQTIQSIKRRINKHISDARIFNRTYLHRWINKQVNLTYIIIEENAIRNFSEMFWISSLKALGFNLVNATIGGEGASIGNKNAVGNTNRKGKKHTKETKLKMSISRKGKIPKGWYSMVESNKKCVIDTKTNIKYDSVIEAAKVFGISRQSMAERCKPKIKKSNRFIFAGS